jgi:4-amino-4-deoxy-L-arabinose transferase-like glycosyltransferase
MRPRRFPILSSKTLWFLVLGLAAACTSLLEAKFIDQPGTEDACYYYSGGLNFVQGRGMNESFYWNYLESSSALPHPGFLYWMPLPSIVAAAGMFLFREGFQQSQIPFLFLSIAFPFWVFWLGFRLTSSFKNGAVAGFLSIFSGFYAVYWLNTESFLLYAWIGSLSLFLLSVLLDHPRWYLPVLAGILCGLAHLTRADGILFLFLAVYAVFTVRSLRWMERGKYFLLLLGGYGIITGFWYVRNLLEWGSPLPSATGGALWLTTYNDLFHFPASDLTPARFFSEGLIPLSQARWSALIWNAETAIFVLGLVFLFPVIGWGAYLLRRKTAFQLSLGYFGLLFFVMTVMYPFQGSRGGFFHSSAALLPFAAVAASWGLDDLIARLSRLRSWRIESSQSFFGTGFVLLALFSTCVLYYQRVIGSDPNRTYWSSLNSDYSAGVERLGGAARGSRFMVNNPPCFYALTGWEAVPVPDGDPATLLAAADYFHVGFIILDSNVPNGLLPLYNGTVSLARLSMIWEDQEGKNTYRWFAVEPPP